MPSGRTTNMELSFGDRLKHAWNVFRNKDPAYGYRDNAPGYYYRPDRPRFTRGNERTIVTAVYNRVALDAAAIHIQHVRTDENGHFLEVINSGLNYCLTQEANIDQTGRSLIQDIVMSMFDEGYVAVVPVDTTFNPTVSGSYDIQTMRTAKILEWYPDQIKVRIYNEKTGRKEDIKVPKKIAAIIENPLYAVINEPNSTMQRLIRKLSLLDVIDEESSSGKLDLIIQLPYIIKTEARRQQAENRRKDIEEQLSGSKYGIAYIDGTERITQLNRSLENNLLSQIEYLTSMLYSQLGITQTILDGTADEQTLLNYYNRTIEPIMSAIVDEMKRKFLTKTARTQNQSIYFFRDPFKLVPVSDLAEIADKFTRNEIMTSNEIRALIGMKPSDEPQADELRNKNLYGPEEVADEEEELYEDSEPLDDEVTQEDIDEAVYQQSIQDVDDLDSQLDELERLLDEEDELKHYASPYYDPVKAHEYYEEHKQLVGRKSTSGLNDEGKKAAKYVKKRLDEERKSKVQAHKEQTQSKIDQAKTQKDAYINSYRQEMNNYIKGLKAKKDSQTKANSAKTKSQIEALRSQKDDDAKRHTEKTQSSISKLQEELKGMSKEDKAANKERIADKIAKLREDNKAERARLTENYKSESSKLRASTKSENSRLNSDYKESSSKAREQNKADADYFREDYKTKANTYRQEHKDEKTRLKNEYDKKYESELESMKSDTSFKKTSKKKK